MDIFELLLQQFSNIFREQALPPDENTIARISDYYLGSGI